MEYIKEAEEVNPLSLNFYFIPSIWNELHPPFPFYESPCFSYPFPPNSHFESRSFVLSHEILHLFYFIASIFPPNVLFPHLPVISLFTLLLNADINSQAGFTGIKRVDSLNDSPTFLDAAADIVNNHLHAKDQSTQQLYLRCPGCVSLKCHAQKEFFREMQGDLARSS